MSDIADLAKRILEENFRQFGILWGSIAICDLVIFGYLPSDKAFKAFHLSSTISASSVAVLPTELPLQKEEICAAFGSGGQYFLSELRKDMEATRNFHPFKLLKRIISGAERDDIGGHIQVAIANKAGAMLPHILVPELDRGEHCASVSFLGREVSEIGPVGDCSVGVAAMGPDHAALLAMRKKGSN